MPSATSQAGQIPKITLTHGSRYSCRHRAGLFLDVDGVISLFGFPQGYGLAAGHAPFGSVPPGSLHNVNGVIHYISAASGALFAAAREEFDLVWATGWEETANEYLPLLLELPEELPVLTFDGRVAAGAAHWKTDAMAEYAGKRPFAWVDDRIDEGCREWAAGHPAQTLLIETASEQGMVEEHVEQLLEWARALRRPAGDRRPAAVRNSALVPVLGGGRGAALGQVEVGAEIVSEIGGGYLGSESLEALLAKSQLGHEGVLVDQADLVRRRANEGLRRLDLERAVVLQPGRGGDQLAR